MNVAPSSSNGYAKYHIRTSGIDRVLAEESTVFSIEDHDDERKEEGKAEKEGEKSRLVECPLDSDEEEEKSADDQTAQTQLRSKNPGSEKELSRLTDEYDLEGDSASDELDLLPPLSSASNSTLMKLSCCRSRVPAKCTIL